jgi:hypothetical protein
MDNYILMNFLIIFGFLILFAVMVILVLWARRRGKGVYAVGALFSLFAPDPTLEQKIVLIEVAKVNQSEEDEKDEQ